MEAIQRPVGLGNMLRKYADVFEVWIPRQHEVVHAGICMDKQAAAGEEQRLDQHLLAK
jgi:hypothetical protein